MVDESGEVRVETMGLGMSNDETRGDELVVENWWANGCSNMVITNAGTVTQWLTRVDKLHGQW